MTIKSEITDYGFDFGSIKVTRTYSEKSVVVIGIATPKTSFSVRATKNGSVRIFGADGEEFELVSKGF